MDSSYWSPEQRGRRALDWRAGIAQGCRSPLPSWRGPGALFEDADGIIQQTRVQALLVLSKFPKQEDSLTIHEACDFWTWEALDYLREAASPKDRFIKRILYWLASYRENWRLVHSKQRAPRESIEPWRIVVMPEGALYHTPVMGEELDYFKREIIRCHCAYCVDPFAGRDEFSDRIVNKVLAASTATSTFTFKVAARFAQPWTPKHHGFRFDKYKSIAQENAEAVEYWCFRRGRFYSFRANDAELCWHFLTEKWHAPKLWKIWYEPFSNPGEVKTRTRLCDLGTHNLAGCVDVIDASAKSGKPTNPVKVVRVPDTFILKKGSASEWERQALSAPAKLPEFISTLPDIQERVCGFCGELISLAVYGDTPLSHRCPHCWDSDLLGFYDGVPEGLLPLGTRVFHNEYGFGNVIASHTGFTKEGEPELQGDTGKVRVSFYRNGQKTFTSLKSLTVVADKNEAGLLKQRKDYLKNRRPVLETPSPIPAAILSEISIHSDDCRWFRQRQVSTTTDNSFVSRDIGKVFFKDGEWGSIRAIDSLDSASPRVAKIKGEDKDDYHFALRRPASLDSILLRRPLPVGYGSHAWVTFPEGLLKVAFTDGHILQRVLYKEGGQGTLHKKDEQTIFVSDGSTIEGGDFVNWQSQKVHLKILQVCIFRNTYVTSPEFRTIDGLTPAQPMCICGAVYPFPTTKQILFTCAACNKNDAHLDDELITVDYAEIEDARLVNLHDYIAAMLKGWRAAWRANREFPDYPVVKQAAISLEKVVAEYRKRYPKLDIVPPSTDLPAYDVAKPFRPEHEAFCENDLKLVIGTAGEFKAILFVERTLPVFASWIVTGSGNVYKNARLSKRDAVGMSVKIPRKRNTKGHLADAFGDGDSQPVPSKAEEVVTLTAVVETEEMESRLVSEEAEEAVEVKRSGEPEDEVIPSWGGTFEHAPGVTIMEVRQTNHQASARKERVKPENYYSFLQSLKKEEERVILEDYFAGMTPREIADSHGWGFEATKKRRYRLCKELDVFKAEPTVEVETVLV